MAEKSSFFNSVNGDRRYKAEEFADYFSKFITNGYYPNVGSNLQIVADGTSMNVMLKSGAAWVNGYMYHNTSDLVLPISIADGVLNRIDRVVVRCDFINRKIKTYVKKGDFATNPVPRELERNADMFELGIADIRINKGVVSVNQSNITDLRINPEMCGVVNSLIQVDTSTLFDQFQDWYDRNTTDFTKQWKDFMEEIKDSMEGDVALNILNKIGTLQELEVANRDNLVEAINTLNSDIGNAVSTIRLNKVDDIYTVVEWRKGSKVIKRSTLSNKVGDNYTKQTVEYLNDNVVVLTQVYTITYDEDGNIVSEVIA